ncbi:uncharacterized protein LOC134688110 [Mytilus trossulus]|uniref:uncharacterized protein LOC134688110 n=1 Tax=Mytilus trossulus TaxID=6551 RepID=UPI003007D90A
MSYHREDPDAGEEIVRDENNELNSLLHSPITENEIFKCIKNLKNGKACGDDFVTNEYIKSTTQMFMPIYVKLFNIVFDTGKVPELWLVGNGILLYNNKGDQSDPQNYRPITIFRCMDDTVLMSETQVDLQKQLDALKKYCDTWKLKVNVPKSKIVFFSKGRPLQNVSFKYADIELDIVEEFTYLGVLFSRTGSFAQAKKAQADKATRAMNDILKRGDYII